MNVKTAIKEGLERDVVLFVPPPKKYTEFLEGIISLNLKKKNKLGLVSLDKGYSDISQELKKKKINSDKILFIDCVSQKKGNAEERDNVFYVSSPSAYTQINIAAKEAMKAGVENIVFDSLSTILLYGDHPLVFKYIQDLITFVRQNKKKIFFLLREDDFDKKIVERIQEIVDKVIALGIKVSPAKAEAVKLMEKLFGSNASKMVENIPGGKKPELLLGEFKKILSKLVGPENAEQQLKELYSKYV